MTTGLLVVIFGSAALDSLNPSLFINQSILMMTPRPLKRMLAYIGGVLVMNFFAGLLILAGFQAVVADWIDRLEPMILHVAQVAAGIGLIVIGLFLGRRKADPTAPEPTKSPIYLHPVSTFAWGVATTSVEVTTALPYLFAIERISAADLALIANALVLVIYNLIYVAPLLAFVGLYLLYRQRLTRHLERIGRDIRLWIPRITSVLAVAVGSAMVINAAVVIIRARGLPGL